MAHFHLVIAIQGDRFPPLLYIDIYFYLNRADFARLYPYLGYKLKLHLPFFVNTLLVRTARWGWSGGYLRRINYLFTFFTSL